MQHFSQENRRQDIDKRDFLIKSNESNIHLPQMEGKSMKQAEVYRPSSIPEDIYDIVNQDAFISSLPVINEIVPVTGGVAHYVYLVTAGQERFYIKIRGDRFIQIPQIVCNPADIAIEYRALSLFHNVSPENFPRVMSFNSEKFYLVLSDGIPNGEKLEALFLEQRVTCPMLFHLGQTLRLCWRMRLVSSDCQWKASGHCWFRPFLLPTPL
jgi:hypothetical protein